MMDTHLSQAEIDTVPHSTWYKYTLECGHEVYTKTRISLPRSYNEHFIQCPRCQRARAHPLNWQPIIKMEAVTDEHVSNVLDGLAFVLPRRILRTDGTSSFNGRKIPSGDPFPYANKDRDH